MLILESPWTRQPPAGAPLSRTLTRPSFVLHAPAFSDRVKQRFGVRSSNLTTGIAGGAFVVNFPNASGQGWVFPASTIPTNTKHTIMFVGNPRSQGAQRNCAINQRISTGAFGGIGFNQVAGSNGAITIQQDAFSYHVFSGATILDVGAHVSSAVTGKLSAYLMARDGVTFLASIDGVAKSVTVNFADSDEPMPAGAECKIGDLGDLATTGYGYQDGVALVAIWDTNLSQAEANFWTANPWQLFAPQQIIIPTPAAATAPTITALSARLITATSAQPRISYS